MSLEFILWRLGSLKTTIEVNQFFPRTYFSQRFSVERTFDPENEETYITLREFTKKYNLTSHDAPSWGAHAAFEVETFQTYDPPDFRKYLNLKLGSHEEERSTEGSYNTRKWSSESTLPTSTGIMTPVNGNGRGHFQRCAKGINGFSSSETRGKLTGITLSNPEDQTSKVTSKFKAVFMFGLKKRNSALRATARATTGRTKALLENHNRVESSRKRDYI